MPILKYKKMIGLFSVLTLLNIALLIFNRPARYIHSHYHISLLSAQFIATSLAIPTILWLICAVIAYLGLRNYSETIGHGEEAAAFKKFSQGQFYLSLFFAVAPILSGIIIYAYDSHPSAIKQVVQFTNYVYICISLIAAILFYQASTKLLSQVRYSARQSLLITSLGSIAFSVLYVFLVFHSAARLPEHDITLFSFLVPSSFYEPDWISAVTIVIPRLLVWFLFGASILNFFIYQSRVKGKLYRKAFALIPWGCAAVLVNVILLRIIQMLPVTQWHWSPLVMLLVAYAISIIGIVGFVLFARGSSKLYKIEKI